MKFLLYALITFATIALGVYLYGHTLAPVRSGTATTGCTAPAHVLLATILDVESQPSWRKTVASIKRTGEASSWVEKTHQREEITFKLLNPDNPLGISAFQACPNLCRLGSISA